MMGYSTVAAMVRDRGPRYVVSAIVRRGEYQAVYAASADEASRVADRYRSDQLRQVRVVEPDGETTLADLAAYGQAHRDARQATVDAADVLRAAVLRAVDGGLSEAETARVAGVDRMTVRSWLGKR